MVAQESRVYVEDGEDGGTVVIGKERLSHKLLREKWSEWSLAEAALKKLDPKPTQEEMNVLEAVATTSAAKNGWSETKQALARC